MKSSLKQVKRGVLLFAKYSGLFALARGLTAKKTRILAYHGIWLGEGHFGNFLYMSAEQFASRMALLKKWNYPVIPFSGRPESDPGKVRCPTVITIDDGWYSTWSSMLPILERYNYPATVYLTTYYCLNQAPVIDVALSYCIKTIDPDDGLILNFAEQGLGPVRIDSEESRAAALSKVQAVSTSLDDDRARQQFLEAVCKQTGIDHSQLMRGRWFHLMDSTEVMDAASRGINFEAHTHHHRIAHEGIDSLSEEISANRECIHDLTGCTPEHFCYPSGRYSKNLWPVLESCNITSATTTEIGLVDYKTPKYAMPRILDGQNISELEFEAEMCGFMEMIRTLRRMVVINK